MDRYPLPENWTDFVCTKENIIGVWTKFNEFPILFDDYVRGDFAKFATRFFLPTSVILSTGDYGILFIENVVIGRNVDLHICFWDRRFKGRDTECKQVLKWMFDKFRLHRASAVVPETVRHTINFITSLGFKQEGIIKENYMYKGKLLNQVCLGILRKDVFGEVKNG